MRESALSDGRTSSLVWARLCSARSRRLSRRERVTIRQELSTQRFGAASWHRLLLNYCCYQRRLHGKNTCVVRASRRILDSRIPGSSISDKIHPFTQPLSPYSARYEHVTTKSQTLSTVILRSYPADSIIRRLNKKETKTWLPKATTKGHQQGLRRKTPPSRAPHGYVCTTKRRDIPKHTSTPKRNCRLKQNDERTGKGHKKAKKKLSGTKKVEEKLNLGSV